MKFHDPRRTTAKAEQTYFAIRGGKAKRVDAASVVEAASVCGGKSHFAAKLRICPPKHAAEEIVARTDGWKDGQTAEITT
ncbi:hypothetical protein DPMN_028266 [Dreissena polymorpha]|uniref:Uncharacterized protein n=1 Tax=Dreissena polymorpha TaxID=45954 RepID=A0A9D4LWZ6_DREPO|nr:hypothetical protein DPMN_028266 [Dreissena polymorpha]